jgi:GNAT superfamily N-acetyltransferase
MPVTIQQVCSKNDLRTFVFLPEKIHAGHSNWVPPIYSDDLVFFNPVKNRYFQECSTILLLAFNNGKAVGRIMGIVNHKYNSFHHESTGRFFALECYNEVEIALVLTGAVEEWCRKQGLTKIIGPFGFSDKDPQGFMIEGFDEPAIIATNYSLSYMIDLMKQCGYEKEADCVDYKLEIPKVIPDFYTTIQKRTIENQQFRLVEYNSRKALKPMIKPVFELINQTYADIFGFSEVTPEEMNYFADRYLSVINPRFVKVIYNRNNELIAFALAMPEISEGIRKAHGRLFPIGFLKILAASRKSKMLTMLLGAIRSDYRNNGIDALLGIKMIESATKEKFKMIDSHLVLESNTKMRAEYEKLGGKICKRYRIFSKNLN